MADAEREAKQIAQLRPGKADAAKHGIDLEKLIKRLCDQSARLTKSKGILHALHETLGDDAPRARIVKMRSRAVRNRQQSDASKKS